MNTNTVPSIPGYEIVECLYQRTRTLVDRGTRTTDNTSVIIKFLQNKYPSFSELVQLRNPLPILG